MLITMLRLSFAQTETSLDRQGRSGGAPLENFASRAGYVDIVDAVRKDAAMSLGLTMPWQYPVGNHFWDKYLHDKVAGDARGNLCYDKLVPLRLLQCAEKVTISMSDLLPATACRATLEGYFYPHGTGMLASVDLLGQFDAAAAGRVAQVARWDKVYRSQPPNQIIPPHDENLNATMSNALVTLRETGFGKEFSGARSELFSIATVVQGEAIDSSVAVREDSDIHRMLNGLASWDRMFSERPAPKLVEDNTTLHLKKETAGFPGNLVVAAERGRAVWFPKYFGPAPASRPRHLLGCYHRNLSVGSLQVDSLLMLAAAVKDEFESGATVPSSIRKLGEIATGLLRAFCDGRDSAGKDTYRSESFRLQIAQSKHITEVNALCQHLGKPPIVATAQ